MPKGCIALETARQVISAISTDAGNSNTQLHKYTITQLHKYKYTARETARQVITTLWADAGNTIPCGFIHFSCQGLASTHVNCKLFTRLEGENVNALRTYITRNCRLFTSRANVNILRVK